LLFSVSNDLKKPEKQDWDDLEDDQDWETTILRQHYVTEAASHLLKRSRTSRKGCRLKEHLERWTRPLWRYRWFRFVAINFMPIPCSISIIMAPCLLMFYLLTSSPETLLQKVGMLYCSLALGILGLLVWLYLRVRKCIQSCSRKFA